MSKIKKAENINKVNKKRESKVLNHSVFSFLDNKTVKWIILLALLVLPTLVFYLPILQGKAINSSDSSQGVAMVIKPYEDYKAKFNDDNFMWSDRLFAGMPTFMMGGTKYASKILEYLPLDFLYKNAAKVLKDIPLNQILFAFGAFLFFFVLLKDFWLALLFAIAASWCNITIVSVAAGHTNKQYVVASILPFWAGLLLISERRYLLGLFVTTFFLQFIVSGYHIQIGYYTLLVTLPLAILLVYKIIKEKDYAHLTKSLVLVVFAFLLAVGVNFQQILNRQYTNESIRGRDIINLNKNVADVSGENGAGVDFDYATAWSFGWKELPSLFIPDYVGGSSSYKLSDNSATYKALVNKGVPDQTAQNFIQSVPLYWGDEPFVLGRFYMGSLVLLFLVLGLLAAPKNRYMCWLIPSIIFTILIALGRNAAPFYKLLFANLPLFNVFRSPTIVLAVTQLLVVIVGAIGLYQFFKLETIQERMSVFKKLAITTLGILITFWIIGISTLKFADQKLDKSGNDDKYIAQLTKMTGNEEFTQTIFSALIEDRKAAMNSDTFRSILFCLLSLGLLYAMAHNKIAKQLGFIGLTILCFVDFWGINRREINDNTLVDKEETIANSFVKTPADQVILQDKENTRMIDLSVDPFNNAAPSYYHRNVGGYNPAKLKRYQDIIENGLSYDFSIINKEGLSKANFFNMLNVRYLKQGQDPNSVIKNINALGNAWFVSNIVNANTNEEEILKVRDINPANDVVINKEFHNYISGFKPNNDTVVNTARYIRLTDENPMHLKYDFNSPKDELVVFSEVIYRPNLDWISKIDGKITNHIRANYILRAMKVRAGRHTIEFDFQPKLYKPTYYIITFSRVVMELIFIILFILYIKSKRKEVHE